MLEIHYFKVVLLLLISGVVGIRTWQENVQAKLFIDMGKELNLNSVLVLCRSLKNC